MQSDATNSDDNQMAGARPFRRHVFYIPGYDPIPPRRYRELYRKEGADQARISGYRIALAPRAAGGSYGWSVVGEISGRRCIAEVDVLVWSDIVRGSMAQGILGTYGQLVRTAWAYIGSGALFRLMRLRKGPMIAALYPIVFLLAQLGLAIAVAVGVTWLSFGAMEALVELVHGPSLFGPYFQQRIYLSLAIGAAGGYLALRGFRGLDYRVFAYYLMHDYAFTAQLQGANPPALEARMVEFGHRVRAALASEADEVLVVGHSSGAHLAVSVLADLIRDGVPKSGPAVGFLSLGQVVPMVSFLPEAKRLRADLAYLSARDELAWVDVTAPGDGCAFALCDPVAVSGVAPEGKRWPLVISAAFTQTLSPQRWRALRWRFFRLHFQYLCAFDRPGDYDYFQITAGPMTLADRYRGRSPSKSRIEMAVNRYRSLA